ncbi:MAG TPA: hypothetical protein VGM87_18790 [Roseomonas sp.]|jgi:hypothetical protein
MRIAYSEKGLPQPVFESGDLVRLCHDDLGEIITFRSGEWGRVVRVMAADLDIHLAGYSRPRSTPMAIARNVPKHWVEPCDGRGVAAPLRQRDLDRSRR